MPLVFVDVGPSTPQVNNIRIDYMSGIRQAVQHLAALRHEYIAFISGPLCLRSALARREAFRHSLAEIARFAGPDLIIEADHSIQGGMAALDALWSRSKKPTAVMCSNDLTAIGVIRETYVKQIRVPRDLSVVGFDDIRLSQFLVPPLSTVQVSQAELAHLAFHALMVDVERNSPASNGAEYLLKTSFIQRGSTACVS